MSSELTKFSLFSWLSPCNYLHPGRAEINHYAANTDPFVLVNPGSIDKVMVGRIHYSAQAVQEDWKMLRRTR
jgi:hypothetical protein